MMVLCDHRGNPPLHLWYSTGDGVALENLNGKICSAEHKEPKVLLRHLTCRKSNPTRGVTKKTSDAERAR